MGELTLEALAKRVAELEKKVAEMSQPKKDWRSVVGLFDDSDSEVIKEIIAAGQAIREADRQAGREGRDA
jgi:hypothetical protein